MYIRKEIEFEERLSQHVRRRAVDSIETRIEMMKELCSSYKYRRRID